MQTLRANFLDKNIPLKINAASQKIIFLVMAVVCLTPFVPAPLALLLGLICANTIGHPFLQLNTKATKLLLQFSVVGLGFGMNLYKAVQAGKQGFTLTLFSILGTLTIGYFLGRILKNDRKISQLISCGTAICGGSAIAAVAPIIAADEKQISIGLGTVFILNSVALFIFPAIGHLLQLSQLQFGLWSAVAIHDTSSVVGAASKYGSEALEIATTVKLARAIWIIPVSIGLALMGNTNSNKVKVPWFILLFVLAMIANTYLIKTAAITTLLTEIAKSGLTLTLFLIGSGLSFSIIKSVGIKPFLQGALLWILVSGATLWIVTHFS